MSEESAGTLKPFKDLADTVQLGNGSKDPGVKTELIHGLILLLIFFAVVAGIYEQVKNNWWERHILYVVAALILAWQLGMRSKGEKYDKIVTMVLWLVIFAVMGSSIYSLIYFFGFSGSNPFILMYFGLQFMFFGMIMVSRYTRMNIVKVIAWALGLFTVFLFFFTFSIWGSIESCLYVTDQGGVEDNPWITMGVYAGWGVVIGSLLAWEMTPGFASTTHLVLLAIGVGLSIYLVGYALQQCAPIEKKIQNITGTKEVKAGGVDVIEEPGDPSAEKEAEAEKVAKTEEYSWINNSIHILTIAGYFSFFTGNIFTAFWYGFMAFYMLDGCAPVGDMRRIAVGALLILLVPIGGFLKLLSNGVFGKKSDMSGGYREPILTTRPY